MMAAGSFILALAGFGLLALSLGKHHRDLLGKPPSRSAEMFLRIGGWLSLAGSLAAALSGHGVAMGIIWWAGLLNAAAFVIVLLLTYRDKWWRV